MHRFQIIIFQNRKKDIQQPNGASSEVQKIMETSCYGKITEMLFRSDPVYCFSCQYYDAFVQHEFWWNELWYSQLKFIIDQREIWFCIEIRIWLRLKFTTATKFKSINCFKLKIYYTEQEKIIASHLYARKFLIRKTWSELIYQINTMRKNAIFYTYDHF